MARTKKTVVEMVTEAPEAAEAPRFAPGTAQSPSSSRDFWLYMETLGERDWTNDGLKAYLYRKSDDPAHHGRDLYLVRFEKPFDIETLRSMPGVGGGTYSVQVKQGSRRIYVSPYFTLDGPANPWTAGGAPAGPGVPADGSGVSALAELLKPLVAQAAGQVASGVDIKAAVSNVMDMQSTAFKSTLQAVAEGRGGGDSLERAADLFNKLGLIRRGGGDGDGDGGFFDKAVKLGLIRPQRSLAEEIADVMDITDKLGGGGGRRGGGSTWETLARELGPRLIEGAVKIAGDVRRIAEVRAGAVGARVPAPAALPARPPAASSAAAPPRVSGPVSVPLTAAGLGKLDGGAGADTPPPAASGPEPNSDAVAAAPANGTGEPVMTAWEWLRYGAARTISGGGGPEELLRYLDSTAPELLDSFADEMTPDKLEAFFDGDVILRGAQFPRRFGSRLAFLTRFLEMAKEGEPEGDGEAGDIAGGVAVGEGAGGLI